MTHQTSTAIEPTLALAMELVSRRSVTPNDAGCQDVIVARLQALGFEIETLHFGDVKNVWATRGSQGPTLCFCGHTDVVPTGPEDAWASPPFTPSLRNGHLYGRGAADMKSGLACMVTAIEAFVAAHPDHPGRLAMLMTSDEEGPSIDGIRRVVDTFAERGEVIDYCVIGECSSVEALGDRIMVGRRGSISGHLTVIGKQGHVAYPHLVNNPVHAAAPALAELAQLEWDQGNDAFPPTSFQVVNLHAGTGASNVVPGTLQVDFNLRYSTELTADAIRSRVVQILDAHRIQYRLDWHHSGDPFVTPPGKLRAAVTAAVEAETGLTPTASTAGGTSDGRFVAKLGTEVVELGPINATIHQVDERVDVDALPTLSAMYCRICKQLLNDR